MQAIILAAGEGKRLRPLTEHIPKPLVPVKGRPILEYTLSILPPEIDEVILVVGYRGDHIKRHFGDALKGISLKYVEQKRLLGTGDALELARPHLKGGRFLVLYADDLYHPEDLANCAGKDLSILVKEAEHPERFGVCIVDENDRLVQMLEKVPNPPSNLVNIGVYSLDERIFTVDKVMLPNGEYNLAEQIGSLAKNEPMFITRARFWHPIGYPEDVVNAERWLHVGLEQRVN